MQFWTSGIQMKSYAFLDSLVIIITIVCLNPNQMRHITVLIFTTPKLWFGCVAIRRQDKNKLLETKHGLDRLPVWDV